MRACALLACVLAAAAHADDGGTAPPARWSHARGSASGSGTSLAHPPESFGGIAWTYRAKGAILLPPVVWDGAAFVLDGDGTRADLVALDVETGETWARIAVTSPGQPAAFARSAFLVEEGKRLVQARLRGRALSREWTFEATGLSAPRIVDGEIYATASGALLSLRAGLSRPAWRMDGDFTGEPAVRDGHVYALRRDGGRLLLAVHARADGAEAASLVLSETAPAAPGGRVVVGGEILAALVPPEEGRDWAIASRKLADGKLELKMSRTEKLLTEPMAGRHILLALSGEPRTWCMFRATGKDLKTALVDGKTRPDLLEAPAPCVWLGESTQCYGAWCGDLNGNVVYWHASERPEGAPLRKGLRFHAVPARHELLLFVPADGKSVLALAPEEIG